MSEGKYHMSSNVIHLFDLQHKSDNKKHFLLKLQYNIVLKKLSKLLGIERSFAIQ